MKNRYFNVPCMPDWESRLRLSIELFGDMSQLRNSQWWLCWNGNRRWQLQYDFFHWCTEVNPNCTDRKLPDDTWDPISIAESSCLHLKENVCFSLRKVKLQQVQVRRMHKFLWTWRRIHSCHQTRRHCLSRHVSQQTERNVGKWSELVFENLRKFRGLFCHTFS